MVAVAISKGSCSKLGQTPIVLSIVDRNNCSIKQQDLELNLNTRRTRKAVFLDEMDRVVPRAELVSLIAVHSPVTKTGRPPFAISTMLRIHFLQQWIGLSDLATEESLFEVSLDRNFVGNCDGCFL